MKKLAKLFLAIAFIFFAVFLLSSCSIIQKTKSKQKAEVSVLETEQSTIEVKSDLEAKSEIQSLTENQLIGLLSALNVSYDGTNDDELNVTFTKTENGLELKLKGKGKADFKNETKTETTRTDSTLKTETKETYSLLEKKKRETGYEVDIATSSKEVQKTKFDFSPWMWIGLIIIIALSVVLYWFFGKPRKE